MKAVWNGKTIAQTDDTVVVENNHYFPLDSVNKDYLLESDYTTHCPWKGTANYYHLEVGGDKNENAVWYYADPSDAAKEINDRVAFWKGVEISEG